MNRLSTWIWKEWREQRTLFLALMGLVPVGVWALFAVLGERLGNDGGALLWIVLQPAVMLGYVLCVVTDVLSGERQRGTLSVVQRMPRGLGTAFLVKLLSLLLGAAVLLAWTLCVMTAAWWLAGEPVEAWRTLESVTRRQSLMVLPALAALLGWIALVSIWLPRGGAAAGAAPILLGLLLLPFLWMVQRWPWFHGLEQVLVPVSALVGLTGLAAAWVSWRHGLRFGKSSWRALRFGLPVVLGTTLCAYGYESVTLHRYLTLERDDPDLRIDQAWLGRGARFVFLEVHREDPRRRGIGHGQWTPSRPYQLDLQTGEWKPLQDFGGMMLPWVEDARLRWRAGNAWYPQVDRVLVSDVGMEFGQVVDATTGASVPGDPVSLQREWWTRTGFPDRVSPYRRLRDGWLGYRRGDTTSAWSYVILDEDREVVCELPRDGDLVALGTACVLTREWRRKGTVRLGRGDWVAHDTGAGTSAPAENPPGPAASILELDVGRAVVCDPERGVLEQWDPLTGARQDLAQEQGGLAGIESFVAMGPSDGGELLLLLLRENPERKAHKERTGQPRVVRRDECLVLVDRASGRVRALSDWQSHDSGFLGGYVGQDDEGALWLIEDRRRLVRIGPEPGQREVVLP